MYELVITFSKSNPDKFFEMVMTILKIEGERSDESLIDEALNWFRLPSYETYIVREKYKSEIDERQLCLVTANQEISQEATASYLGDLVTFLLEEKITFDKDGEIVKDRDIEKTDKTIYIADFIKTIRIWKKPTVNNEK